MPFASAPCHVWLPKYGEPDAYNDVTPTYGETPDIVTTCCYAPGSSRPDTSDDLEQGRPEGVTLRMTFFLPKTLDADLRGARIACPQAAGGLAFDVDGAPTSYMRENTPGDYSWAVEGVAHLG